MLESADDSHYGAMFESAFDPHGSKGDILDNTFGAFGTGFKKVSVSTR